MPKQSKLAAPFNALEREFRRASATAADATIAVAKFNSAIHDQMFIVTLPAEVRRLLR